METDVPSGSWRPASSVEAALLSQALGRALQLSPDEIAALRRYLERIDQLEHLLRTLHASHPNTAGHSDVHEGPDKRWREQHGPRAGPAGG